MNQDNSLNWQDQISQTISAMSWWEVVAVVLGIAYLLLAMRESIWCWYAAFISTSIYIFLFWDVSLYMESALNIFYLLMAVYGWWQWHGKPGDQEANTELPIQSWDFKQHVTAIGSVLLLSAIFGSLLSKTTDAALPYLDSLTTWGSVITTWMVTKKVLENWLYWLVVDSLAIYLYIDRELYLTAGLFMLYLVIVVFGYFRWLAQYRKAYSKN